MRILGLDIGRRRTGVSFVDMNIGVPLALDTLQHTDENDLVTQIMQQCDEREVDLLVIGLPLLPSGDEGMQSSFVRLIGDRLETAGMAVEYLDERYTTGRDQKESDGDARAACELLLMYVQRMTSR
jgi:putative Holliday junction resolvase